MMRWLALLLILSGCDEGKSATDAKVTPDTQISDAIVDGLTTGGDSAPDTTPDGTADDGGLCDNWADMGLDCCDVCTQIYATCNKRVKDKQGNPLTGKQCFDVCVATGGSYAGNAYDFISCMMKVDAQAKCDPATLQACFDKMFE